MSLLSKYRRTLTLAVMALAMVAFTAMPAYATSHPPPATIKSAAVDAATAGIAAGAAVAVIVLGGTVVYRLVKKFTT